MKKTYDENESIEVSSNQVEDDIEFIENEDEPYISSQFFRIAFNIVCKIGLFTRVCEKCNEKFQIDKTWENSKLYFAIVLKRIQEFKNSNQNTVYGATNAAIFEETPMYLVNLAATTTSDRDVNQTLTTTNNRLM